MDNLVACRRGFEQGVTRWGPFLPVADLERPIPPVVDEGVPVFGGFCRLSGLGGP